MITETQRKRRGHAFLPPKAELAKIPDLYETDSIHAADKIIYAHYFSAGSDHYVAELDPDTGEAYGYAKLASSPEGAEWGYFDLAELEAVNVHGGLVIVERDCHWSPKKFSEVTP